MTGEIINWIANIWQTASRGFMASIDGLSALWWVVVWWLLSFLTALFIFHKQKEHDVRSKKIDKALELLWKCAMIKSMVNFDPLGYMMPLLWDSKHKFDDDEIKLLYQEVDTIYFFLFKENSDLYKTTLSKEENDHIKIHIIVTTLKNIEDKLRGFLEL